MPDRVTREEVTAAISGAARATNRHEWWLRLLTILVAVVLLVVGALFARAFFEADQQAEKTSTVAEQVQTNKTTAAQALDTAKTSRRRATANEHKVEKAPLAAARRVIQYFVDKRPIKGAPTPGPRGPAGAQGIPGITPSRSEILSVVAAYCSDGACRGPQGPPGVDGQNTSVSAEQIADAVQAALPDAVAAYCEAHDQCRGPAGETVTGPQGPAGADSQVPGPPGPAGTTCPATAVVTNQDGSQVTVCTPG